MTVDDGPVPALPGAPARIAETFTSAEVVSIGDWPAAILTLLRSGKFPLLDGG